MAFVTGETADYKRSDAIAEMAIKWAQERREKIEVNCFSNHSLIAAIYLLHLYLFFLSLSSHFILSVFERNKRT